MKISPLPLFPAAGRIPWGRWSRCARWLWGISWCYGYVHVTGNIEVNDIVMFVFMLRLCLCLNVCVYVMFVFLLCLCLCHVICVYIMFIVPFYVYVYVLIVFIWAYVYVYLVMYMFMFTLFFVYFYVALCYYVVNTWFIILYMYTYAWTEHAMPWHCNRFLWGILYRNVWVVTTMLWARWFFQHSQLEFNKFNTFPEFHINSTSSWCWVDDVFIWSFPESYGYLEKSPISRWDFSLN